MSIVARLEGAKSLECIAEKLKSSDYEVVSLAEKVIFVFKDGADKARLDTAIKAAKDACNFNTAIKYFCGTSSGSY